MSDIRYANAKYSGTSGPIFNLSLKVAFLTLVTLGIYRFWGKTRLRKFIWSSASVDGDRFEYTGTGLEKFLGFLIAVVFLAIYMGIVQTTLVFLGLNLLGEPQTDAEIAMQALAANLTFLSLVPFLLFAVYRARRYRMARTRWRGIRFGMDKGAWGYALRAIGHYLLSIITLGVLLPRQTFKLEKYITDRTWFGDTRFEQGGTWTGLYAAMKHIFLGLAVIFVGITAGVAVQMAFLAGILVFVGYIWFMIGMIDYRVQSFAYLTSHKRLGDEIAFEAQPRTTTIVKTYIVGGLIIGVIVAIFGALLGAVGLSGMGGLGGTPTPPSPAIAIVLALGYVALVLGVGAAATALITQPVIAHYIGTLSVANLDAVDAIRQRAADTGADAEGFADALDIGGAI